jgi:hypothetical protein
MHLLFADSSEQLHLQSKEFDLQESNNYYEVRWDEILTMISKKINVFWNVAPRSLVDTDRWIEKPTTSII